MSSSLVVSSHMASPPPAAPSRGDVKFCFVHNPEYEYVHRLHESIVYHGRIYHVFEAIRRVVKTALDLVVVAVIAVSVVVLGVIAALFSLKAGLARLSGQSYEQDWKRACSYAHSAHYWSAWVGRYLQTAGVDAVAIGGSFAGAFVPSIGDEVLRWANRFDQAYVDKKEVTTLNLFSERPPFSSMEEACTVLNMPASLGNDVVVNDEGELVIDEQAIKRAQKQVLLKRHPDRGNVVAFDCDRVTVAYNFLLDELAKKADREDFPSRWWWIPLPTKPIETH